MSIPGPADSPAAASWRSGMAGTGSFDFRIVYPADEAHPDVAASICASLQGLGLKLEAGKGAVETLVIGRAEKPSSN